VQVLGAWLDPDLKERDLYLLKTASFQFVPVLDCTLPGSGAYAAQYFRRARRKVMTKLHGLTGRESPHQLGFGGDAIMARAQTLPADLFIAHSELCLQVAWRLMRRGRRVGVDMEDWFAEDLLPEARGHRPLRLLRFLERELLTRGAFSSCPSRAMSEALCDHYACRPPLVVYNAFSRAEQQANDGLTKDRRDVSVASICWYSQTLGPSRGLEDLVDALPLLECQAEVHLRGRAAPGMTEWIRSRIPDRWQQRIFFHSLAPNHELLSRIAEHDIGFAGETPSCSSRDLTVTNKILHYLLGGLAVVASDTTGQREVAAQAPGAVELYPSGKPEPLAQALNALLGSPDRLPRAKAASLQAAEKTFCWERQEGALLEAVAAARCRQARCLERE
jgi:glycosyltransferase involved in cell wall biosynthesis